MEQQLPEYRRASTFAPRLLERIACRSVESCAEAAIVAAPAPRVSLVPNESTREPETANALLRLLRDESPSEYARLLDRVELVALARGEVLFEPGGPLPCVYFQDGGVTSMLRVLADGRQREVAAAGAEGVVGFTAFFGAETALLKCVVTLPGSARRLAAAALRDVAAPDSAFHGILQRYAQYLFDQATQSAACSGMHEIGARVASWLLSTHDRLDGDRFELTHGTLASMLGVRRASVSQAAEALRRGGAIEYSRGRITILDRAGLEAAACECYAAGRVALGRLYAGADTGRYAASPPSMR